MTLSPPILTRFHNCRTRRLRVRAFTRTTIDGK
jgi:hypothetical protein